MVDHEEINRQRDERNIEVPKKLIESENIFKSKISLAFEEPSLEEIYDSSYCA